MEDCRETLDSTLTEGVLLVGADNRDDFRNSQNDSVDNRMDHVDHWSNFIRQTVLYVPPENVGASKEPSQLPITLAGGSSNRQFVFIDIISHAANIDAGELFEGDILLQVNDVKVGGFTLRDIESLLVDQVNNVSPYLHLAVIQPDAGLPLDLEELLRQRFSPSSPEHSLQSDVRININRYIVPYTTKVEDAFDKRRPRFHVVSKSDFVELEEQQYFLESGVFQDNFYGTPCPPNITAQEVFVPSGDQNAEQYTSQSSETPKFTESDIETSEVDLPEGWEKVADAGHGTYYVDHINKTTQFERPPAANVETASENVQLQSEFEPTVSLEDEVFWEEVRISVIKSSAGFGFTLQPVGPSYDALELYFDVNDSNLLNAEASQYYHTSVKIFQDVLQITEVVPSGSADTAGLKRGDILYRINGTSAVNCDHKVLAGLLHSLTEGDVVQIIAKRFNSIASSNHLSSQNIPQDSTDVKFSLNGDPDQSPGEMVGKNSSSKLGGRVHVNSAAEIIYDASLYNDGQSSSSLVHKAKPPGGNLSGMRSHSNISSQRAPPPPVPKHPSAVHSFNMKGDRNFYSNEQLNGGVEALQAQSAAVARSNTLTSRMNRTNHHTLGQQNQTPPISGHIINVSILKSNMGFGFTIASTGQGQMEVMQIVDKERCHQLRTGDVILSVNGYTPSSSRYQMDGLLKNCPAGRIALLTVLRDPYKHKNELNSHNAVNTSNSFAVRNDPRSRSNTDDDDHSNEFVVSVRKQTNEFGFEILGGAEEECNIIIGAIMPDSAASQNGRMRSGDEIISINSENVLGASHYRAVSLINKAKQAGVVTMRLRHTPVSIVNSSANGQHKGAMYDVQIQRKSDEGFGFVVVTSLNKQYTKIGGIVPGSPADRITSIQLEDRVHAVNGTKVQGLDHSEIVGLIKGSGLCVTLTISKGVLPINQAKIQDDKMVNALTNQFLNTSFPPREQAVEIQNTPSSRNGNQRRRSDHNTSPVPPRRPVSLPPETDLKNVSPAPNSQTPSPASVGQILSCRLVRDEKIGFGFSVRGGIDVGIPINVFKIAPDGPAERSQLIQIGDVVLEVNGLSTHRMSHQQFLDAVRKTPSQVLLVLSRASNSVNPGTPVGNF